MYQPNSRTKSGNDESVLMITDSKLMVLIIYKRLLGSKKFKSIGTRLRRAL